MSAPDLPSDTSSEQPDSTNRDRPGSPVSADDTSTSSPRKAGPEPCISLQGVYYCVPNSVFELTIPDFTVAHQEKVVLTGPSGSGKTTLLSLISARLTPTRGNIHVAGLALQGLSATEREQFRLKQIGIVFQEFRLLDYLTVQDNLSLKYRLPGQSRLLGSGLRDMQEEVKRIAERLRLSPLLKRYPHQLSQGERQRVAIGRAIYGSPALILADEPTGNLDPRTANESLEFLFQVIEETEATLLLVTHDHSILPRFHRHVELQQLLQTTTNPV